MGKGKAVRKRVLKIWLTRFARVCYTTMYAERRENSLPRLKEEPEGVGKARFMAKTGARIILTGGVQYGNEENVSAEETAWSEGPWFPEAYGDSDWPEGLGAPSCEGPRTAVLLSGGIQLKNGS